MCKKKCCQKYISDNRCACFISSLNHLPSPFPHRYNLCRFHNEYRKRFCQCQRTVNERKITVVYIIIIMQWQGLEWYTCKFSVYICITGKFMILSNISEKSPIIIFVYTNFSILQVVALPIILMLSQNSTPYSQKISRYLLHKRIIPISFLSAHNFLAIKLKIS